MAVAGYLVACGLFVAAALAEIDLAQRFGHAPAMDYTMAIGAAVVWGWAGIAGRLIVPSSRVGTLMVILAGLSFVNALGVLGLPADFPGRSWIHAGHLLSFWLMAALVVHLLVTHPHGIARTAGQRRLVHASYALAVTIALAILLAWAPASPACGRSCVTSPISINDDLDLGLAVSAAGALCALAMSVVVMAYLTLQYARASPRHRSEARARWLLAVLTLVIFACTFAIRAALGVASPWWLQDLGIWLALTALAGALVFGLARERLAQASMAELVGRLVDKPPARIQAELSAALRDDGLRMLLARGDSFVDAWGAPAAPAPQDHQRTSVLESDGHTLALVIHDVDLEEQPALLAAAMAAATVALQNAALRDELRHQLEEVTASRRRLVSAADQERERIERNLHDGAQQHLLGIGMRLRTLRDELPDTPRAQASLIGAEGDLRQAIRELRELAQGIHPAVLVDEGLTAACGILTRRTELPVTLTTSGDRRCAPETEAAAYYIVSEAVQNAVKHAAPDKLSIDLAWHEKSLEVRVVDDGPGGATWGSGVRGMPDRANAVGGTFTLDSPTGRGTSIRATLPTDR